MKYDYKLSRNVLKWRRTQKNQKNIKSIVAIILIAIIGNLAVLWAFQLFDQAYENRAAAAGYELPKSEMRINN
jgi:hypothetical protein